MSQKLPDDYQYIKEVIAPRVMEKFLAKASDYGDAYKLLGAKGQFSDINRKFWKLYNSVWCERELSGEQPIECAEDIIGHCLLLMMILEREETPDRGDFSSPERPVPPTLSFAEPVGLPEDRGRSAGASTEPTEPGKSNKYSSWYQG